MPLYEYRCSRGHITEQYASIEQRRLYIDCPKCDRMATRRFHAPAIHFKGAGFYNTDYKQKKHHGAKEDHSTPQETKEKADAGQSGTPNQST